MSSYSFECPLCATKASDSSRGGIELFTDHHMRIVHPLLAAKVKAVVTQRLVLTSRTPLIPPRMPRLARGLNEKDAAELRSFL